jgi:hypothetical protein
VSYWRQVSGEILYEFPLRIYISSSLAVECDGFQSRPVVVVGIKKIDEKVE